MVGGVAALAGAIVIGPRLGKYTKSGESVAIPGHDIPMAIAGTFILAFGWFGFNPGSTLAGGDLRIAVVATNTMLAGTGGALAACFYVWKRLGKPDPAMIVNGLLAGLVAITAPCAFVNSASAVVIGALAGVIVVESVLFIDRILRIDDPVGAISVHGVCGAFGTLCVGIFADGSYGDGWNGVPGTVKGLLYGDASQLAAEAIGVVTCFVFVFVMFFAFFKVIEATMGNRVSAEAELEGLDIPEMGALAYPDFVLGPGNPLGGHAAMTPTSGGATATATLKPMPSDA
jgi:Amt family ammonium transporter